jgi:hypothetical protein
MLRVVKSVILQQRQCQKTLALTHRSNSKPMSSCQEDMGLHEVTCLRLDGGRECGTERHLLGIASLGHSPFPHIFNCLGLVTTSKIRSVSTRQAFAFHDSPLGVPIK